MIGQTLFELTVGMLDDACRNGAFPGFAAAVGNRERILFQHIAGEAAIWPQRRPVMPQTRYDLASLSKVMATTLVTLRLADQGKIILDQPISHYIDGVPPDKQAITWIDLLRHTAGFPAHFMLSETTDRPEDAARVILTRPLACRPGTQVIYSCMGFILLGRLLEHLTGLRLDQLAAEHVFSRLNLKQTGYLPLDDRWMDDSQNTAAEIETAATEYDPQSGRHLNGQVHDENARFLKGVSGNAGVFSNLADCSRLACCLLSEGDGLLSPDIFRQMVRNWTPDLNEARGLGFAVWKKDLDWSGGPLLGAGAFGHTGFTGTSIYVSPYYDLYLVLLTNRVHFGRDLAIMPKYRSLFHEAVITDWLRYRDG